MHRTDAPDYIVEDGKRRWADQQAGVHPGTVDGAEYNNAVQEELANLIELVGNTLNASSVADRAAGWRQVYDAIFQSSHMNTAGLANDAVTTPKIVNGAVTDAKIAALDLAKAFGAIDIDGTLGDYQAYWQQAVADTFYLNAQNSDGRFFEFSPTGLQFFSNNPAHSDNLFEWEGQELTLRFAGKETSFSGYGVQYDDAGFWHKGKTIAATGISWAVENGHHWATGDDIDTGIAHTPGNARPLFQSFIRWQSGSTSHCVPADVELDGSGSTLIIASIRLYHHVSPPSTFSVELMLDGQGI
jgi:hypothetical protein